MQNIHSSGGRPLTDVGAVPVSEVRRTVRAMTHQNMIVKAELRPYPRERTVHRRMPGGPQLPPRG
jgi:hypothetical protein